MSDPCSRHKCTNCCGGLYTYLTEDEIDRIEISSGVAREEFIIEAREYRILLQIDDKCFFLSEGRCRIHQARPDVCRAYPVVVPDSRMAELDADCPHRNEFTLTPELIEIASAIGDQIELEAARRRGYQG